MCNLQMPIILMDPRLEIDKLDINFVHDYGSDFVFDIFLLIENQVVFFLSKNIMFKWSNLGTCVSGLGFDTTIGKWNRNWKGAKIISSNFVRLILLGTLFLRHMPPFFHRLKGALNAQWWLSIAFQARQLENQIDLKLVAFSKLGSSLSSSTALSSFSDKAPLLDDTQNVVGDASTEIADLLARLAQVNEGLADFAARQSQSAAIHHTLQRHRDILLDYRQEFNKTKANLEAMAEREDLLSSVHRDINDYRNGVADGGTGRSNKRMDLLLKETESARNSERLIDDQINIAIESRETLVSQRIAFKAIQTKLNDIANRFPVINSLVQKINIRKRRDTLIVGLVIGLCLTFMIWYAFWWDRSRRNLKLWCFLVLYCA